MKLLAMGDSGLVGDSPDVLAAYVAAGLRTTISTNWKTFGFYVCPVPTYCANVPL